MRYTLIGLSSAVGLALAAGPVSAQQTAPSEAAALERRLAAMEGEMSRLRAELAGLKAEKATPSGAAQSAQRQHVQTTGPAVRFGGFLKTNALFSRYDSGDLAPGSLGRDFYLPGYIPVGGTREHSDADFIAKQTRLTVSMDSGSGLSGYVEADFQTTPGGGSERTTNGYNLALRRAYITYGRWLFGQDWTTFLNAAALPESTDFVGPTEGTVFVRQPQVRYTLPLGTGYSLAVALENPETASITPTAATLIENDDDRLPDVTARLSLKKPYGEFAVALVARQLAVDNGAMGATASGYGLSLSGQVPFGKKARHDLRFMLTGGQGIGRYVGLNFAPDVVYAGTPGAKMELVGITSGFAAVKLGWTPRLRSTFAASFLSADYPAGSPALASKSAQSLAANLFFTPVRGLDLGIELRTGKRELLNGQSGRLDRLELAAKYAY